MEQPSQYLSDFPLLYDHRMGIRTMIDRCEESMLYIKQWMDQQGWGLDLRAIQIQHPEADNIFQLLEPYIQPSPSQSEVDKEQRKVTEFEVEY
jgi:hypothetical protein